MDNSIRAPDAVQNINHLERSWSLFADKKSTGTVYWDTKKNSFASSYAISSFFTKTVSLASKGPSQIELELPTAFHSAIAATQETLAILKNTIPHDPTVVKSYRVALENLKVTLLASIHGSGGYQYALEKLQEATSEKAILGRTLLPLEKETLQKAVLPQLDTLIASLPEESDDLLDSTFNTLSIKSDPAGSQKAVVREMVAGIKNNITPVPLESDKELFIPLQSWKDFPRSPGYSLNSKLIHENTFPEWESAYKEFVHSFQEMYGKNTGAKLAFKAMSLTNQSLLNDLLVTAAYKTQLIPLSASHYFSVTISPQKISIEMRTIIPFHEVQSVMPVKREITLLARDLKEENNLLPSLEVKDTWLPLFKNPSLAKEILHKF